MIRVIRVCDHCQRNVEIDLTAINRDRLDQTFTVPRVGFACDGCIQGALKVKAS